MKVDNEVTCRSLCGSLFQCVAAATQKDISTNISFALNIYDDIPVPLGLIGGGEGTSGSVSFSEGRGGDRNLPQREGGHMSANILTKADNHQRKDRWMDGKITFIHLVN